MTLDGRKIAFKRRRQAVGGGAGESAAMKVRQLRPRPSRELISAPAVYQEETLKALEKLSKSMLDVPYNEMFSEIQKEGEKAKNPPDKMDE